MRQATSFLDALRNAYLQQGQAGRILLPAVLLLGVCCLCLLPIPLLRARTSPSPVPSPLVLPTDGTQASPTPLFSFDFPPDLHPIPHLDRLRADPVPHANAFPL